LKTNGSVGGIEGDEGVCPLEVRCGLGCCDNDIPIHAFDYAPGVYRPDPTIHDIDNTLDVLEGELLVLVARGLKVMWA
jgi:hypothetical protein